MLHRGAAAQDWGLASGALCHAGRGICLHWVVDDCLCFRSHRHSSQLTARANFAILLLVFRCEAITCTRNLLL